MTEPSAPRSTDVSALSGAPLATPLSEARERAVRLLSDGFAYDAITVEEFEWRLGQLSRANTPRDIDALVADLAVPMPGAAAVMAPVVTQPSEGRIVGIMSQTRRDGPWRLPQLLQVKGVMSEVKIDLRRAVIPPHCTIDVTAIMANVTFTVPPGMIVDFDVSPIMASTRNDARGVGIMGYELPHVRIRGSAIMAEVRVRVRDLGR
jgi:hypothetical protein